MDKDTNLDRKDSILKREMSRREVLKWAGLAAAATAAAPVLAACNSAAATATAQGLTPGPTSTLGPASTPTPTPAPTSPVHKVTSGTVRWRGDTHYAPGDTAVVQGLKVDEPNLNVTLTSIDPNVIGILWAKTAIQSGIVDLVNTKNPKFGYLDPLMNPYLLTPLDDYFDLYGWKAHMNASTIKHATRNGHIQQAAFYLELPGIAYRPSTLQKAGLSGPPATWNDFITYLKAMKAAGVIPLTCAGRTFSFLMLLQNMFWASIDANAIKNVVFGDAKWTDGSAEASAAAIVDLKTQGLLDPDISSIDVSTSASRFLAGKAAMNVTGTWFFATMQSTFGGTDWDLFAPPSPAGGPMWCLGEDQGQSIAHNAKDPDAAAAVIDYVITGNGAKAYTQLGNLLNTDAGTAYEIPQVQAVRKEFSAANAVYLYGWLPAATSDAWQNHMADVLTGAQTPKQWAASVQAAWERDISQGNVPADRSSVL